MGHTNPIRFDRELRVTSELFQNLVKINGIIVQLPPIEAHNAIGIGERYHAPLRPIYLTLGLSYSHLQPRITLTLALKGMSDTLGPEGLLPSFLVLGTNPTLSVSNESLPTQRDQMDALSLARLEMASITEKILVVHALRSKLPLATKFFYGPGDNVSINRKEKTRYCGPFKIERSYAKKSYSYGRKTFQTVDNCLDYTY